MWTAQDILTLKAAIGSGILIVSYDGPPKRLIQYQSLDAMRALLASMVQDVAKQNGASSFTFATTNKGFHR